MTYLYKSDDDAAPRRVGVLAQDVQKVLPEAISEHDGILAVRYSELVPLVINAVNELHAKESARNLELERLKQDNARLKTFLCSKFSDAPDCTNDSSFWCLG